MAGTSKPDVNDSLVSTFSNDGFGLTANVCKSEDAFEIILIDPLTGEEVLTTCRATREEAEKFAVGLMKPSLGLKGPFFPKHP